ncbi:MAG: alginate export family protein [Anaerolineae bacterium]|nr:alginate export family protein [Gloeobacterales cyanobacterium ES-bin-313]
MTEKPSCAEQETLSSGKQSLLKAGTTKAGSLPQNAVQRDGESGCTTQAMRQRPRPTHTSIRLAEGRIFPSFAVALLSFMVSTVSAQAAEESQIPQVQVGELAQTQTPQVQALQAPQVQAGELAQAPTPAVPATTPAPASVQVQTTQAPAAPAKPTPLPAYRPLRYDEDYRYLRTNTNTRAKDLWDPLKYIPLNESGSNYLSIGADVRERYESFNNPFFGLRGVANDNYLYHRFMLHGDLHLGDNFRVFLQFNNTLVTSRQLRVTGIDQNPFDISQAFFDVKIDLNNPGDSLIFRTGRQEISLGAGRFIFVRDPTNTRLSFDGLRTILNIGQTRVDAFLVRPILLGIYALDDRPNANDLLYGVYSNFPAPFLGDGRVDLYYLGFDRLGALFSSGRGHENRHTFGARLSGRPGAWDYDVDLSTQVGTFDERKIEASAISGNFGYTLRELPWQPRLGLKANFATGDKNPSDNLLQTFNPLYPAAPLFGSEALLTNLSNVIEVHPTITVRPIDNLSVIAEYDWLWRESSRDGVYLPNGQPLISAISTQDSRLGTLLQLKLDWQLERHIALTAVYTQFAVSDVLRSAGAKTVDFFGTWLTYRF